MEGQDPSLSELVFLSRQFPSQNPFGRPVHEWTSEQYRILAEYLRHERVEKFRNSGPPGSIRWMAE